MQRTFKSKVGWWYYVVLAFCIWSLISTIWYKNGVAIAALFACNLLIVQVLLKTEYIITDGMLLLKCWIMPVQRIPIAEISSVKDTHNPLSSYALSLDRLKIEYAKTFTLASPKNKQEFVNELKKYNPSIVYISRKK